MSVPARKWALSKRTGSSARRAVLNCLADWMIGDDAVECWPSIETIVFDTEMNRKTIMKATAELEAQGLIEKRRVIDVERRCWQIRYSFVGYVPNDWINAKRPEPEDGVQTEVSPKNGTSQKRNVPKAVRTKNGTEVSPKNGTELVPKTAPSRSQIWDKNKEDREDRELTGTASLSPSDKKALERPQADVPCNGSRQISIDESLNLEADLFAEHEKGSDLHAMQSEAPSAMPVPTDAQNAHSAQIEGVGGRFSMPKSKYPACPYEKIVALYHEICPTLPRIAVINESRKRSIKSRWLELCKEENYGTEDEGLEGMKVFFQIVKNSRFLTGRVDPSPGRNRPFIADLDFLMRPTKFIAVFEGKYDGTRPQVVR